MVIKRETRAVTDVETGTQRWSQNFGPVVKVDRMKKVTIQNEETKEPFAGIQSQGCA